VSLEGRDSAAAGENEERADMPIFMDRHDMRGATAENVAEAHRKDLEIQDRYGVKYMTYWDDERHRLLPPRGDAAAAQD
jgi:hypothetical protein